MCVCASPSQAEHIVHVDSLLVVTQPGISRSGLLSWHGASAVRCATLHHQPDEHALEVCRFMNDRMISAERIEHDNLG